MTFKVYIADFLTIISCMFGGIIMIRGISKKIIEVNNTGSDIFEKAVFYVRNDRNECEKELKAEADRILCSYILDNRTDYKQGYLRKKDKSSKRNSIIAASITFVMIMVAIVLILFV